MINVKYSIDENTFAISFINMRNGHVFMIAESYPDGTKFDTFDEAKEWADLYVASLSDFSTPYAPSGRGEIGGEKFDNWHEVVEHLLSLGDGD